MNTATQEHESDSLCDRAAQFAAGSMTGPELVVWRAALDDGQAAELGATADFEPALLVLADTIAPVEPPCAIKTALLEAIAPPKGFVFRFAGEASFRPTPIPGVSFRLLHRDKSRDVVTCLLRLAPGARLPSHSHRGVEECVVIEGTILVGPTRMRAGDYQRAEADSDHVEQWTDTGALVYLSGPEDLFV